MYGSIERVRLLTGTTFEALGFRGDGELDAFIVSGLTRATAYINADRGRSYDDAPDLVLAIASDIAERIAANEIRAAERQRNKSLVTPEGGQEMQPIIDEPTIFTPSILKDLKRLPRSAVWHISVSDSRNYNDEED